MPSQTLEPVAPRFSFDDTDMDIYPAGAVPRQHEGRPHVNVGDSERNASAIIGGALTFLGLTLFARRRPMLGTLLGIAGGVLTYRGATGYCPVYAGLGVREDETASHSAPWDRELVADESIVVHRRAEDLYAFWRDLENLPKVMEFLERVDVLDDKTSRWIARGPGDRTIEWTAVITAERPNELLAWTALEGSELDTSGSVHFLTMPDGDTLLRVHMIYRPPAGVVGGAAAKLLGRDPARAVRKDLWRFKCVMEAGEVPSVQGQPRGQHC